jgi:hypothetical protein
VPFLGVRDGVTRFWKSFLEVADEVAPPRNIFQEWATMSPAPEKI